MNAKAASAWRHRLFMAGAAGALAVVILVLGYLGVRNEPLPQNSPVKKLGVALVMAPQSALMQIALVNGYFTEEGLDLAVTPTTHGKIGLDLLLQGDADLVTTAEVPFVLQVLSGQRLGIAATVLTASNEMAVVARRDHDILAPRDLTKKKIGVTLGTTGEYFLWTFLIRQRLRPDSVTLVDLPPGQIVQALADGTVDAIATWQPIVSAAQSALGENGQKFTEANAYSETHVVVGRSEFLAGHPEVMEKLVRALLKAEQFNRSEPERALNLVAARLNIDVGALRSMWNDFHFDVNLLQSQLITLEDEARWAMERGYAKKGQLHNFLPNLYLDALWAVRPERVTVVR
jgi:ABC-type nitrate/sulfonate/bicarbonate transport system substrate-binding protein